MHFWQYYLHLLFSFLLIVNNLKDTEGSGTRDDLLHLMDVLFKNYTTDVRPVYNLSDIVRIHATLYIFSILDFDEVAGYIALSAGLLLEWKDPLLTWIPADFGGVDNFVINASKIWHPNIYLMSSAEDVQHFHTSDHLVRVSNGGTVKVRPGKMIKSMCWIDMTNFPTDSHTCPILLAALGYQDSEVILTSNSTEMNLTYFNLNGEWKISGTSVTYDDKSVPTSSILSCTISVTRRGAYFVMTLATPAFSLWLLNPFIFLIPVSSGERISFTVTIFLSLAVLMTLIGDVMPKVSQPMAGMSYFFLVVICFSCVLIVLTILTVRCESAEDVRRFPKWLLKTVCMFKTKPNKVNTSFTEDNTDDREEGSEPYNYYMEVTKSDVTNFIDKFMFVSTSVIVVSVMFGFIFRFYSFD